MVTAVTCNHCRWVKGMTWVSHNLSIGLKSQEKRKRILSNSSFAYTQTVICLYPNDCVPIPNFKRI